MYDRPAGQAVRSTLASIASGRGVDDSDRALLQARVHAAVDDLKSIGWPIERIIVRMKEVAAEVGVTQRVDTEAGREERLVEEAVRWCIERYYAQPTT